MTKIKSTGTRKAPAKKTSAPKATKPTTDDKKPEIKPEETAGTNLTASGSGDHSGSSPDTTGSSPDTTGSTDNNGSSPYLNALQTEGPATTERKVILVTGADHAGSALAQKISSHGPCIVIPYKKDSAAGMELLYALRAWDKNMPECSIVIIGDREDWFSDEVHHISAGVQSENPQIDVAFKMLLAIADDNIPQSFVWSNDDIFPVTPLHPADLLLLTSEGILESTIAKSQTIYSRNRENTLELLKSVDASIFDYSTHTPFVFDKDDLAKIISTCGATEVGHLISSLYYNIVYPGVVPLKIDGGANGGYFCKIHRKDPPVDVMKAAFRNRKFVNVNNAGYQAALPILEKKFSEKSRFEI